jgi:hypothetical protein
MNYNSSFRLLEGQEDGIVREGKGIVREGKGRICLCVVGQ